MHQDDTDQMDLIAYEKGLVAFFRLMLSQGVRVP